MQNEYVGTILAELLVTIGNAPSMEPKDLYVQATLEKLFGSHDWTKSFHSKQVLCYDEVLPSEVLVILHQWLRRKCADIENIRLVTTHHLGIKNWWESWCTLNHEKSFDIKEVFYTNSPHRGKKYFHDIPSLPSTDFYIKNKDISKLFSFYGGGYPKNDRQYLILKMLEFFDTAEIDFLGKFYSKEKILAYAENILYYENQAEIDHLTTIYDRFVKDDGSLQFPSMFTKSKILDEKLTLDARQWEVDSRCWASIVRETANDDFYTCLTEKTLRAFLHHVAVVPLGFQSVLELEKLRFWFPHDIIDYSYQHLRIFSQRISGVMNSMQKILDSYSMAQLQEYYLDNIENFHHNAKLVYDYINNKEQYL